MFNGDVNLSCTMTFLSTLGSFAFTSLWVYLLGRHLLTNILTLYLVTHCTTFSGR